MTGRSYSICVNIRADNFNICMVRVRTNFDVNQTAPIKNQIEFDSMAIRTLMTPFGVGLKSSFLYLAWWHLAKWS